MKSKDIIVKALPRFDGQYESTSYNISTELAKNNRVIFVDNPFTLSDIIKSYNRTQIKKRWKYWLPFRSGLMPVQRNGADFHILLPRPILPFNFLPVGPLYDFMKKLTNRALARRIKRAAKKLGFHDLIYINSFSMHFSQVQRFLKPLLSVYHCVDQIIKPYNLKHGIRNEKELIRTVDMVVSTSKALQRRKGEWNENSFYVPNAANFEFAAQARLDETPTAPELQEIQGPILGFFGVIERRTDFQLIKGVCEQHPDWTFAMVGPTDDKYVPKWFYETENIKCLGRQPYERLPEFLKNFTVGIIPFQIDEVSNTIFPLKLFEYLGAGLPTVTTNFNPDILDELADVIYRGDNAEDFAKAVEQALKENNEIKIKERIKVAGENTWQARGVQFDELLEKWVNKKRG